MAGRNEAITRRSGRLTLRVPLNIYERGSNGRFCVEEAYSVKVSLWGGLVASEAVLDENQKLLVRNQTTGEIAESEVVYLGLGETVRLFGLKFLRPLPAFWGVSFPPTQTHVNSLTSGF
jgi:hypothetical protein